MFAINHIGSICRNNSINMLNITKTKASALRLRCKTSMKVNNLLYIENYYFLL